MKLNVIGVTDDMYQRLAQWEQKRDPGEHPDPVLVILQSKCSFCNNMATPVYQDEGWIYCWRCYDRIDRQRRGI